MFDRRLFTHTFNRAYDVEYSPVKLTFLPVGNKDNISFQSIIDLTNADVYVPTLALKKERGIQGQFQFNFNSASLNPIFLFIQSWGLT